jgi:hypothetical protein
MDLSRNLSGKDAATDFLLGGGEMGQRMRDRDWSQSPLGPAEAWPSNLKTSLSIALAAGGDDRKAKEKRRLCAIEFGEGFPISACPNWMAMP